ncbi:MAG: nickel pincer cofactor biosynthesis protein LarC [Lachnospiraceae bacterium]|nr:nickel pincer cofactor biosynthesis protein LarC [Lachnospiraceae bacterium]
MGQALYFECNSGISGDMTVAALLDLGADEEVLRKVLDSMPLNGFEIEISRVKKAGLDVCDFNVRLDGEHENHDHDMEYLHGHELQHEHEHSHEHGLRHGHEQSHGHEHHPIHAHEHRGLPEITRIIEQTHMSVRAKETSLRIFDILARAEAKAHGTSMDEVHFHEVGAVDSIVDIVAAAVCLDNLDITDVIIPCLCEGRGTVRCQHGILPIPVPAVANIVQTNNIPLRLTEVWGELVTPTGAAIAAALRSEDNLPEQFTVKRIGMGGGKRQYERPSILRAMLIQEQPREKKGDEVNGEKTTDCGTTDRIYKIESNIDDCTGEMLGHAMERLFENGALEVNYAPVFMKKNRPAYLLTVLCSEENVSRLESVIFRETTTIGVRKIMMERTVLDRKTETIALSVGEMKIKKCTFPDGTVRIYPEYESAAELAGKTGKSMADILNIFSGYAAAHSTTSPQI